MKTTLGKILNSLHIVADRCNGDKSSKEAYDFLRKFIMRAITFDLFSDSASESPLPLDADAEASSKTAGSTIPVADNSGDVLYGIWDHKTQQWNDVKTKNGVNLDLIDRAAPIIRICNQQNKTEGHCRWEVRPRYDE